MCCAALYGSEAEHRGAEPVAHVTRRRVTQTVLTNCAAHLRHKIEASSEEEREEDPEPEFGEYVASGVPEKFFYSALRATANGLSFELRAGGELYIVRVPSTVHSDAEGHLLDEAKQYRRLLGGMGNLLLCGTSRACQYGPGTVKEPDVTVTPQEYAPGELHPPHGPFPRVVMEVEFRHRNSRQSMHHGKEIFKASQLVRGFVSVHIYRRRLGNVFAACAVLWEKDPVTDAPAVTTAVSFGSAPLTERAKQGFERHYAPVANYLPEVTLWTVSLTPAAWVPPAPPPAGMVPAVISISSTTVLHQIWNPLTNALAVWPVPTPDLTIDLRALYQEVYKDVLRA
eukprot:TRINITY_DN2064_c1_g1_i1.p1 TRINITY_DN2064_c1_g1~~TRINITY_DN2064_c1_g1_i1.p1  ORF type:complete len:341 (-),score=40.35 TRINITY_DN2064_c1_g1_i1:96-1118(-)